MKILTSDRNTGVYSVISKRLDGTFNLTVFNPHTGFCMNDALDTLPGAEESAIKKIEEIEWMYFKNEVMS